MVFKGEISPETKAYVRFLRVQGRKSFREISKICGISKSSVERIVNCSLPGKTSTKTKTKKPRAASGRPKKISPRAERFILRELRKLRSSEGSFSVARLMTATGLSQKDITIRSVSNVMHKAGYGLYDARKKGRLSIKDLRDRVRYAKKMGNRPADFWSEEVAFYLDGVSFTYKTNPHDQARSPGSKI